MDNLAIARILGEIADLLEIKNENPFKIRAYRNGADIVANHPHDLGTLLDERGIAVRTGYHCAQPLLASLGLGPTTRASFALYNSHDEVERLVDAVAHALEVLR